LSRRFAQAKVGSVFSLCALWGQGATTCSSRGSYACGDSSGGVVGVNSATSCGSWKQEESVNLEQKSAFVQRCISLSERIVATASKAAGALGKAIALGSQRSSGLFAQRRPFLAGSSGGGGFNRDLFGQKLGRLLGSYRLCWRWPLRAGPAGQCSLTSSSLPCLPPSSKTTCPTFQCRGECR